MGGNNVASFNQAINVTRYRQFPFFIISSSLSISNLFYFISPSPLKNSSDTDMQVGTTSQQTSQGAISVTITVTFYKMGTIPVTISSPGMQSYNLNIIVSPGTDSF
jgi:hypothetical protein